MKAAGTSTTGKKANGAQAPAKAKKKKPEAMRTMGGAIVDGLVARGGKKNTDGSVDITPLMPKGMGGTVKVTSFAPGEKATPTPKKKPAPEKQYDLAGEIPQVGPEHIPTRVIDELREACRVAKDFASAFSDACNAQAEKHKIAPGALKTYVKALENDKLQEAEQTADDLAALIDAHGQRA